MSLALKLIHTTLATVIQCFDLSVVGGVVDMTEGLGATMPRARRLICTPKARLIPLPSEPVDSNRRPHEACI